MANLKSIQKRRVDELFAEDIPEDEVIIMNTGKYSCKVCHHRPVFDTVNVLALHRSSKKHLQSVEQKRAEDTELLNLVAKRQHEQFMKNGTLDIQIAPEVKQRVENIAGHITKTLQAQPYDPRVKKAKIKRHQPRQKMSIDLASTSDRESSSRGVGSVVLPEQSKRSLLGIKRALDIGHHTNTIDLNPYVRKQSKIKSQPAVSSFGAGKSESSVCQQSRPGLSDKFETLKSKSTSSNGSNHESSPCKQFKKEIPKPILSQKERNPEEQKKAEHYLKLREAGWVKDRSGNWIKDENAEFDSDEDEPPDMP